MALARVLEKSSLMFGGRLGLQIYLRVKSNQEAGRPLNSLQKKILLIFESINQFIFVSRSIFCTLVQIETAYCVIQLFYFESMLGPRFSPTDGTSIQFNALSLRRENAPWPSDE